MTLHVRLFGSFELEREGRLLERFASRERIVLRGPQVLIERLNDVPWLRDNLPPAIAEPNFAIGEVANNFSRAPFAGGHAFFESEGP